MKLSEAIGKEAFNKSEVKKWRKEIIRNVFLAVAGISIGSAGLVYLLTMNSCIIH